MLNSIVERYPRNGFWKCFGRLRRQGHRWNHKRVHRVYCERKLILLRRKKRRVPTGLHQPLEAPRELNRIQAPDFMADALYEGRKFRILNVIDEANREALATLLYVVKALGLLGPGFKRQLPDTATAESVPPSGNAGN